MIHSHRRDPRKNEPVTTPIYLTSTFEAKDIEEQVQLEEDKADTFYTRYGNPTLSVVEQMVAELEATEAAVLFGSGMAAITTSLLSFLQKGDHAVFQREIYGGAHYFASEILPRYGVNVSWVSAQDTDGFRRAIADGTRVVYLEAPTNPTLRLVDIHQVATLAKGKGALTFIDSTFATPFNTRPVELGVDGVLHSATKYLGGHSDLLAGALAGSRKIVNQVKSYLRVLGGVLDPHAGYLLLRGLKTLGMRVRQHNKNGLAVAQFLEEHADVDEVFHPMLESHPQYLLAREQMAGGGGVVSFEVRGGLPAARRFANAVQLLRVAPSLGGIESLLSIPCLTSHAMLTSKQREVAGISDGLIRLALGIEAPEDLIKDIDQALKSV